MIQITIIKKLLRLMNTTILSKIKKQNIKGFFFISSRFQLQKIFYEGKRGKRYSQ